MKAKKKSVLLRLLGIALSLFVLFGLSVAGGLLWWVMKKPGGTALPLDEALISLESPRGKALLASSTAKGDWLRLKRHFVPQSKRSFCGVASSTIVLNALAVRSPKITQETFFQQRGKGTVSFWKVLFTGMTLEQLAKLLQRQNIQVKRFHAERSTLKDFRTHARKVLTKERVFLVVNYARKALKQVGVGHISPIAAYHKKSDKMLVLDVASHKYPPVWVDTKMLWKAMVTVDKESKRSRGWVHVGVKPLVIRKHPQKGK